MLRYAITDSKRFGDSFAERKIGLLTQTKRLAADGVDYIQLREKDLQAGELVELAEALVAAIRSEESATKLLLNARADVAFAAGTDGVHLTSHSGELTPAQVRDVFTIAETETEPIISVSCHTLGEVERAAFAGKIVIIFGPVFEKRVNGVQIAGGTGLDTLHAACRIAGNVPVLALGGISAENLESCLLAGAAGIAGIRIFQ